MPVTVPISPEINAKTSSFHSPRTSRYATWTTESGSVKIFETYDKFCENELAELMMEDICSRIEERRRKMRDENESRAVLDKLDEMIDEIRDLRLSQSLTRPSIPWLLQSYRHLYSPYPCNNPFHF